MTRLIGQASCLSSIDRLPRDRPGGLSYSSSRSRCLRPDPGPRARHLQTPLAHRGPARRIPAVPKRRRCTPECAGFVEKVLVDRGSVVKQGQLLAELSAPEMAAEIAEAASRVHGRGERPHAGGSTTRRRAEHADRLKKAAETPGAIAGNEVTLAEKQVDAARALVSVAAARRSAPPRPPCKRAGNVTEDYLQITAPFDGVVTDRLVHPGALVGPGADAVLLVIQQVSRLRLTVAVPETDIGGIVTGAKVDFTVPAFPERDLHGHGGARRPRARPENAHHARRTGRAESRRLALARHVSRA